MKKAFIIIRDEGFLYSQFSRFCNQQCRWRMFFSTAVTTTGMEYEAGKETGIGIGMRRPSEARQREYCQVPAGGIKRPSRRQSNQQQATSSDQVGGRWSLVALPWPSELDGRWSRLSCIVWHRQPCPPELADKGRSATSLALPSGAGYGLFLLKTQSIYGYL